MDSVFFHVHRQQIDHPGALLLHQLTDPNNRIIVLSEYSEVVNCLLHLLYVSVSLKIAYLKTFPF